MNAELRAELKAEEAKRRLSEVIYFRRATSKLEVAYVYCCMAKVVTVYRLETEMKILERTSRRYLSQLEKLGLLGKKPTTYPTDRKRYFVIPNPDPETILSLKLIKSRNRDGRGSTLRVKKYKDDESKPQFRNPITTPGDLRREEEAKRRSEDTKRRDEEAKMREESREKERPERLKAQAEKLRDLPANSDIMAVVDLIRNYCDTSEFSWPDINIYARENGCTFMDENTGLYCGSNCR